MIGVIDSGIGGVTVLKEIIKILPNYHYIYYSDSINNPYGDKNQDELNAILKSIVSKLINKECKIIVLACNTASAMCKEFLRDTFSIPIIAIEPALKMVDGCNTLVMATHATINSDSFNKLFNKYNNGHMSVMECSGLADLIEQNKSQEIKNYLKTKLTFTDIQNVVLGCTHYPLIKKEIKEVLGDVTFYDGSKGVAKELKRVIKSINLKEQESKIEFIDSSNSLKKEIRFYDILHH